MFFTPSRGILLILFFSAVYFCWSLCKRKMRCCKNRRKAQNIPSKTTLHFYPHSDKGKCIRPYIYIYMYIYIRSFYVHMYWLNTLAAVNVSPIDRRPQNEGLQQKGITYVYISIDIFIDTYIYIYIRFVPYYNHMYFVYVYV